VALLSVVLRLRTVCQNPFETYLHHHPVSAAVLKMNCLAGRMVLTHCITFVIGFAIRIGKHKLSYVVRTYLLNKTVVKAIVLASQSQFQLKLT